jgi:hypothetical protein
MITFTKSYKTEDGEIFASIEEAQAYELSLALRSNGGITPELAKELAKTIISKKDFFVDILTMAPSSKPKARAIHGGKKTRTPKTIITDANVSVTSPTINKSGIVDTVIAGLPTS